MPWKVFPRIEFRDQRKRHALEPTGALQDVFDVLQASSGEKLRTHLALVHRSVVAFAFSQPALAFHTPGFFTQYVHSNSGTSADFWARGYASILWTSFEYDLFGALSIDVVVINCSAYALEASSPRALTLALASGVRALMPDGLLVLADKPIEMPRLAMLELLAPSIFANVFRRANSTVNAATLPICERLGASNCEAAIGDGYVSLGDASRKSSILKYKDLALGRFRETRPNSWFVGSEVHKSPRYVGPYGIKPEWDVCKAMQSLVKSGRVKSFLDAGAGTCSMYGVLVQQGLHRHVHRYMAFGGYNGQFLRMCGERGTIEMDLNWLNPLPFCQDCQFDMVFQAQGVHHNKDEAANHRMFSNFDAVLTCGGWLVISDSGAKRWQPALAKYTKQRNYTMQACGRAGGRPVFIVEKRCGVLP